MTNQLSKNTDKILNNLSRTIGAAELLIEKGTAKKDEAWEEVFGYLEEHGDSARFVANDGYSLIRQSRQSAPKLDEDKLKKLLDKKYGRDTADVIWSIITVRKVDSKLLETLVKTGQIDAKIVDECITVPDVTYARVRRVWSKDDVETAAQFDIQVQHVLDSETKELAVKILDA